jgi:lipoprotein-releasing system permease protein
MNDWLPFEWIAASRFLREGRMQTLFIIIGVSIGVGVIIFMSAMLEGMRANFIRRVLSVQSHVVLLPAQEIARPLRATPQVAEAAIVQKPYQRVRSIDQWQKIIAQVAHMREVTTVSPMASGSVLAVRGEAVRAITVIGIEPDTYFRIVPLPEKIVAGSMRLTSEDIVVGTELAADLGVIAGDKLRITKGTGEGATLTISGIVDLGAKSANQRNAYVALHTAQALLGLSGGVSSIDLAVRDVYAAEQVAQAITAATGVQADSWIKTNAQFYSAITAQTIGNTAIRFFVALSVAFGIAAVLIVSVVQKSKEIGILRAMGAARGQILRIFLLEGAVLGLAGSVFGSALGATALLLWQTYMRNPDGTPFVPISFEPRLFILSAVLAMLTGLAAAVAPALRGARLDPVVAIRG